MKRIGAKNTPVFRIVVADNRSPRDGKFIEEIGAYQPLKKGDNFILDYERAKYWLGKGAQPSDTVASFIRKAARATPAIPVAPATPPPSAVRPGAPTFFSETPVEAPHEDLPTLFAEELISEKSLDEVILAFLSADLEPPK